MITITMKKKKKKKSWRARCDAIERCESFRERGNSRFPGCWDGEARWNGRAEEG